jgi:predicted NBD/HSP70 family sugar kinase
MFASMPDRNHPVCGGIDLGGTKIEATLFDAALNPLDKRRLPTPTTGYEALLDALVSEINWLRDCAGQLNLPVGIGMPGLVDPTSGVSVTANLPANGRMLARDLSDLAGGRIITANDCKAFALSEASGGAGAGYARVFGLILGTGLGGGFCRDGVLDLGANGLVGEVGHFGLPAHLVAKYDLPLVTCGCGRIGCFETLVSGTGLTRLANSLGGVNADGAQIVTAAASGDTRMGKVFEIWMCLTAELIHTIQLHLDPDCIVLGGGLSQVADLDKLLTTRLQQVILPSVRAPKILKPQFGDSSGGRGAALLVMTS